MKADRLVRRWAACFQVRAGALKKGVKKLKHLRLAAANEAGRQMAYRIANKRAKPEKG